MTYLKNISLLRALLFISALVLSCTSQNSEQTKAVGNENVDSTYVVDIIAADFAYGMPSEIPSGWVTFRMENRGKHEHHGIIEKFPDSLGIEKLSRIIYESLDEAEPYNRNKVNEMKLYNDGGPSLTSPGKTSETTFYMEPGLYVFTCWLPASDGEYHAQKGMRRVFQVTEEESGAARPEATIGLTLSDYAIEINDPVSSGEQVFDVQFEDNHNVHLARLEEGQELDTLIQWMNEVQTPAEFTFLGGAENEPPGSRAFFKADLEPGRYALVSYRLAKIGMVQEFRVPSSGFVSLKKEEAQPLNITIESERMATPETVPTGIHEVRVKNNMDTPQRYLLDIVIDGYTSDEAIRYFEDGLINRKFRPGDRPNPTQYLGGELLNPGAQTQFKLNIQEDTYIIWGPFKEGPPPNWTWSTEKVSVIQGIDP